MRMPRGLHQRTGRLVEAKWLPDAAGIVWVVVAGIAVLIPALVHGISLGPFDLLSQSGLSKQPGVQVHNPVSGDLVDNFIPWSNLAWSQVHHGQLPLWNPYSGMGAPLAFNWQSAPFSAPAVFGYLVPVRFAFDVGVIVTVSIAGTGAYVLGRVLHFGILASALTGTVFALSGQMAAYLGYPQGGTMSWAGWLFTAALLVVAGRHRARSVAFFAVVLAFAVYAGHPETLAALVLGLATFLVVLLALRVPQLGGSGQIVRPVVDLSLATIAGVALAAPLILPGLQLVGTSTRTTATGIDTGLGFHELIYLIFQGFDGLPIAGSRVFGYSLYYQQTVAYVGVIAVVLGVVGLATYRRRPEITAFAVLSVAMAAIAFIPAVLSVLNALPITGKVQWLRVLVPMALGIAALSGAGMDAIVHRHAETGVRRWTAGAFAGMGLVLFTIFLVGRGHLPRVEASIRARSFVWPFVETAVGLAVVGGLTLFDRRTGAASQASGSSLASLSAMNAGRVAGLCLLACATGFLVTAGAPLWSSSSHSVVPTTAEVALQRAVGTSLVGTGGGGCFGRLGILPDVNAALGVHELDVYDPVTPAGYFTSWTQETGQSAGFEELDNFCPAVVTAAEARRYGVSYILEQGGSFGPTGSVFVRRVGDEELYRIPNSGVATATPLRPNGQYPPSQMTGTPVRAVQPDPRSWTIVITSGRPQALRVHVTDVPGWSATIDGRPLPLDRYSGTMLQAKIPSGHHVVQLTYWPVTFTIGLAFAACSVIGLTSALVLGARRRRGSAQGQRPAGQGGAESTVPLT